LIVFFYLIFQVLSKEDLEVYAEELVQHARFAKRGDLLSTKESLFNAKKNPRKHEIRESRTRRATSLSKKVFVASRA